MRVSGREMKTSKFAANSVVELIMDHLCSYLPVLETVFLPSSTENGNTYFQRYASSACWLNNNILITSLTTRTLIRY